MNNINGVLNQAYLDRIGYIILFISIDSFIYKSCDWKIKEFFDFWLYNFFDKLIKFSNFAKIDDSLKESNNQKISIYILIDYSIL